MTNRDLTSLEDMLGDWRIHLRSKNLSARTIKGYLGVGRDFRTYLQEHALPEHVQCLRNKHIEHYLADLHDRVSPATVARHYRSLQQLFRWLDREGELPEGDPMRGMPVPKVEDQPVDILSPDDLRALLNSCSGGTFHNRRDEAIMRVLLDTGMRSGELLGIKLGDVDRENSTIYIMGKGGIGRRVPFGPKTSEALSRYLRLRRREPMSGRHDALWLSHKGALTQSGLNQMLERRGYDCGVRNPHPHRWRHTFAHMWKAAGGLEDDLMQIAGWRSRAMLDRYGRSAANERAHEAHRRAGIADQF